MRAHRIASLALLLAALAPRTGRAQVVVVDPNGQVSAPATALPPVEARAQLLITDLRVIEDPLRTDPRNGQLATWSFRYLMENMAGANDPADFTLRWLEQWERDQVIDGERAPARPRIRELVIDPWLQASGGQRLDLARAPFKLLAIVNRIDLRRHDGASVDTAGEGRFVFGLLAPDGRPLPPGPGPGTTGFTVIFEYEMVARSLEELRSWASAWGDLGRLPLGSAAYRVALERITRRFTDRGIAPGKPNGNAINQIRSNEIALAAPWELREFTLDPGTGMLRQDRVAVTPDTVRLNGTPALAELINGNAPALLDGSYELPASEEGPASLSGPFTPRDFPDFPARTFVRTPIGPGPAAPLDIPWSAAGIADNDARQAFALNTCGGCHRTETASAFVMVGFPPNHRLPVSLGVPAALARFLTGTTVPDPVEPTTPRLFNDLERRRQDLLALLQSFLGGPGPITVKHAPRFVH